MNYRHFPERPSTLTAEFVRDEYRGLTDRIADAEASETPDAWLALFEDWNTLSAYLNGEGSRISFRRCMDLRDAEAEEADRYFRTQIAPEIDNGSSGLVEALLASRHQEVIAERYGEQLLRLSRSAREPLAPVNTRLRVEVSELSSRYDRLIATGSVTIGGETVTLEVAAQLQASAEPAVRREAYIAYGRWFREHRDELSSIYDEMVQLRHEMARNLGHASFVPLGYLGMGRTDYGPEEVARFRENVRRYAVPLQTKLVERQARALGTATLHATDTNYDPSLTLPRGIALPVEGQLEKAQRVFDALSPRLGEHFARMRREGLIDLENRPGKQAGAFCSSFDDAGQVAILCNSTGDSQDVTTLMHEMGHAFQRWESEEIEAVELRWPTKDAAEIFSMGMEYLSMRHITEFFDEEDADKFRRDRWKRAITLLCYLSTVDEFQHWIYEYPNATRDEREQAWTRFWDVYKPGVDYTGVEELKSSIWYRIGHLFWAPFYMIDYAIAEVGAMQLALIDSQNHDRTMETYLELCRMGGTASVLGIFEKAGLRSPFDPDLMRDLMNYAAGELGIEEIVPA